MSASVRLEGSHFWQVLAVGIPALASLFLTTVYLAYVVWQHARHYLPLAMNKVSTGVGTVSVDGGRLSRRPSERVDDETNKKPAQLGHLHTQFGILFTNLVAADFIQALAFSLNWHWVAIKEAPLAGHRDAGVCSLQGALINVGDVGSALWSLAIASHTLTFLVVKRKPPVWVIYCTMAFVWCFTILLSIIGPIHMNATVSSSFYAWTRVWCFISSDHQAFRLWLHYLWILICLFIIVIIYVTIHGYLVLHDQRTTSALNLPKTSVTVRIARRMLLYPFAYACVVLPLTTVRLISLSGHTPSEASQTFAGCCLALAGFVDCVLYITTRSIIFRDPYKMDGVSPVPKRNKRGSKPSHLAPGGGKAITVTRECITSYDVDLQPLGSSAVDRKASHATTSPSIGSDIAEEDSEKKTAASSSAGDDLEAQPRMHGLSIDDQLGAMRASQELRASADFGWPPRTSDAEPGNRRSSRFSRFANSNSSNR